MHDLHDSDLVNEAAACRIIGGGRFPIHRSTLWRGIAAGRYPKPIKVSAGSNRWRVRDLRAVHDAADDPERASA